MKSINNNVPIDVDVVVVVGVVLVEVSKDIVGVVVSKVVSNIKSRRSK